MSDAIGLPTPRVAELCGVPVSTLNSWVTQKLVRPSLADSEGQQRATRYWSIRDIVTVRAIRALRAAGCPLSVIKRVQKTLEKEWNVGLSDAVLWWNGRDLLTVTPAGDIVSLVTQQGQGVFVEVEVSVTCPVGVWESQLDERFAGAELVDFKPIRKRRRKAAKARDTPVEWGRSEERQA